VVDQREKYFVKLLLVRVFEKVNLETVWLRVICVQMVDIYVDFMAHKIYKDLKDLIIQMTQEKINSKLSSNSETTPMNSSTNITEKKSKDELNLEKNLSTILDSLIEGNTLTHCIESKITNPSAISLSKFYNILKKNPQLEQQVLDARKIGVQTLIDRLLEIFMRQELENPNQILWIRSKTDFVKWVAGKITDLYSDNKVQSVKTDQSIKISWEDNTDNLIDVSAEDIPSSNDK
jgi:hypothetical protein